MRRMLSVLSAAAVLTATTVATAVPAFAQTPGEEEFVPDISVRSGQPGDPVWGYLTVSDGCVDFFGALDVPGHTSDSSNEFRGPVCLF